MKNRFTPKYAFLTSGVGQGSDMLLAFDEALREAGISSQNLVPVSSVFPPGCKLISREEGIKKLNAGRISFCVLARHESNAEGKTISSAVGLVIPSNKKIYGYLSECESGEKNKEDIMNYAQEIAIKLLTAKLGIDSKSIDYKLKTGIAQSTVVEKNKWASVVSACVFIL